MLSAKVARAAQAGQKIEKGQAQEEKRVEDLRQMIDDKLTGANEARTTFLMDRKAKASAQSARIAAKGVAVKERDDQISEGRFTAAASTLI